MCTKLLQFFASSLIVSTVVGINGAPAWAMNLVTNGSFEVINLPTIEAQSIPVPVGSALIPGWQVTQSEVHLTTGYWISPGANSTNSSSAYYSLDLDGNTGTIGGISQTISTEVGQLYNLTFFMGGNYYEYPQLERQMEVFWDGKSLGIFRHQLNASDTATRFSWDIHQIEVVGTGRDELRFTSRSTVNAGWGAAIDLVSVQPAAVPEPMTVLGVLSSVGLGYVLRRKRSAK